MTRIPPRGRDPLSLPAVAGLLPLLFLLTTLTFAPILTGVASPERQESPSQDPAEPAPPAESGGHNAQILLTIQDPEGNSIPGAGAVLVDHSGIEERPTDYVDGALRFDTPVVGTRDLSVHAPDHYHQELRINLQAGEVFPVTAILIPFEAVSGLLLRVGVEGKPGVAVDGADVRAVWTGSGAGYENASSVEVRIQTGPDDGLLLGFPGSGQVAVTVTHDFLAPRQLRIDIADVHQEADIATTLKEGHRWIEGHVTAAGAAPNATAPDATARLLLPVGIGNAVQWVETRAVANTDAAGRFLLPAPAVHAKVHMRSDGHFNETFFMPTGRDGPTPVVLTARPASEHTIVGRVTLSDDRTAAGARVGYSVWVGVHQMQAVTVTDEHGRFELAAPAMAVKLLVECDQECTGAEPVGTVLHLSADDARTNLNRIVLPAPPLGTTMTSGVVAEGDGTPVPGATIWVYDAYNERIAYNTAADETGRFQVPGGAAANLYLVVQGPGTPPHMAGLMFPSGYTSRMAPYPPDASDPILVRIDRTHSLEGVLNVTVHRDSVAMSLEYTLPESAPLVHALLLDGIMGDGDGVVGPEEVARANRSPSFFSPLSLEHVGIVVDGIPMRVPTDAPAPTMDVADGRTRFVQTASASWRLGGVQDLELKVPQLSHSAMTLVLGVGEGLRAEHLSLEGKTPFNSTLNLSFDDDTSEALRHTVVVRLDSTHDAPSEDVPSTLYTATLALAGVVLLLRRHEPSA